MAHSNDLSDALLAIALLPESTTSILTILTGSVGSGKTTLCARLLELANERSLQVGGVYSPAVMEREKKIGIDLLTLPNSERRRLAVARETPDAQALIKRWVIDDAVVAWGNAHLARLAPPELLIIDELGPLEFSAGSGFQAAFPLLDGRNYRWGVVVIRPNLLALAQARWPWAQVIALDPGKKVGR